MSNKRTTVTQAIEDANSSVTAIDSCDLTVEELLKGNPHQPLEIPELAKNGRPGLVFIRELPASLVVSLTTSKDEGDSRDWLFELVAQAVCNREGEPMFSGSQAKRLSEVSIAVFQRLQQKVMEVNPLSAPKVNPLAETQGSDLPTN